MKLAATAIDKRVLVWFTTIVALAAGMASYRDLGKLEDPEFTIKTAVVATPYPGASPLEVEQEVTDRIERAVQEMPQVKEVDSVSEAGLSRVRVIIQAKYRSPQLPQIWDELRRKMNDVRSSLPAGAAAPIVNDDFGDVYGFLLAIVGDGFTWAELKDHVDDIRKELSLVAGVARVEPWGEQQECVYVEISRARLAQLGIAPIEIRRALELQNEVVQGGGLDLDEQRVRFEIGGAYESIEDIGDLVIRGASLVDPSESERILRVRDLADVRRGYVEPASSQMRYNGLPAIGLAISNQPGTNIIEIGQALDASIHRLERSLPVGIEFRRVSWQGDVVEESINGFMVSLGQAVAIVLIVLWIAMGLRPALVVGMCGLAFVIVITFVVMKLTGVDLHRMSLGALVIAMGMMVDNAIVVVDGMMVRMQRGLDRKQAAIEATAQPAWPLLGATVVAVMAFYPIFASTESAGEYCATLFTIAGASLLVSWVLAMSVTPLMCMLLLKTPKGGDKDPYAGLIFRAFRAVVDLAMRQRFVSLLLCAVLLVVALLAFTRVEQMFFPASARAQLMIDYWAPEGTRFEDVSESMRPIEDFLLGQPDVTAVASFIGAGPPRFYLPVDPEAANSSYGQLVVNVDDRFGVDRVIEAIGPWAQENVPQALVLPRRYGLGPSETWPFEAVFMGPDAGVLRELATEAEAIVRASAFAAVVRSDWRDPVPKLLLDFDQSNARWTGVSRPDLGRASLRAYDGQQVGVYREEDELLPILLRHPEEERHTLARDLTTVPVRTMLGSASIPLGQVTSDIEMQWEDALVRRFNRKLAIKVQAIPTRLVNTLKADVGPALEAMELPEGYELWWDGEIRSSKESQQSLIPGVIPAVIIMAVIIVALFNAVRPPLIVAAVVPFALVGVSFGLLGSGQPFGFVALLGAMSLAGMMVKSAIVLLDQINLDLAEGKAPWDAVLDSALSRLRPVMLAAGTTVLGVVPLLKDVFWVAMAVTIMAGLSIGSILTMILVPVLYATLFRLRPPAKGSG